MNDKEMEQMSREHRIKNFDVTVEPTRDSQKEFDDEMILRYTHNGFQWYSVELSPAEASRVIETLQRHLHKLGIRTLIDFDKITD